MRVTPRLGLILSSVLLATLGSSKAPKETSAADLDALRIVGHGDGERVWVRFDRPMVEPEGVGSPAPLRSISPAAPIGSPSRRLSSLPIRRLRPRER